MAAAFEHSRWLHATHNIPAMRHALEPAPNQNNILKLMAHLYRLQMDFAINIVIQRLINTRQVH